MLSHDRDAIMEGEKMAMAVRISDTEEGN